MPVQPPRIDYLPGPEHDFPPRYEAPPAPPQRQTNRRFWLFAGVFGLSLAASLAYVWQRPAVYQATATVLTVAPAAIDQPEAEASVQHVAVQRQALLG